MAESASLTGLAGVAPDAVVFAGHPPTEVRLLSLGLRCITVTAAAELRPALGGAWARLVVTGPGVSPSVACSIVAAAAADHPNPQHLAIVTAVGEQTDLFGEHIDNDVLAYLSRGPLADQDLWQVMRGVLGAPAIHPRPDPHSHAEVVKLVRAEAIGFAAADSLMALATHLTSLAARVVAADRFRCLFYDSQTDTLFFDAEDQLLAAQCESAASGLAGFVLRTRAMLSVPSVHADPRFDADVDDPEGEATGAWAGAPLLAASGTAAGVLVAVRKRGGLPFDAADLVALAAMADHAATHADALLLARHSEREALHAARTAFQHSGLFRSRAVAAYAKEHDVSAGVLQLSARWTPWAYWLVVAGIGVTLLFGWFGRVNEYAIGPAVVRAAGCTELTATEAGVIDAISTGPGEVVAEGTALIRLHEARESAEYSRSERRFQLELVSYLRTPGDPSLRERLAEVRLQRDFARAQLDGRSMKAPHDGFVSELRVRVGQKVEAGDVLASLCGSAAHFSLVAALPGWYRPQLRDGMPLSLELNGYEHTRQHLVAQQMGNGVVDSVEAWRFIGRDPVPDARAGEPVVLLTAQLSGASFFYRGREYQYYAGMSGRVEVPVREERILEALVPPLKYLTEAAR